MSLVKESSIENEEKKKIKSIKEDIPDTVVKQETADDGIVDIVVPGVEKKRFRINGNNAHIVELNTSDLNILSRYNEAYPKLQKLTEKAATLGLGEDEDDMDSLKTLAEQLTEIDREMRQVLNELFDYDVSSACAPNGNMYDPINGQFRYENILDGLLNLYTNTIQSEADKIKARVKSHTDKYIPQDHRKKG